MTLNELASAAILIIFIGLLVWGAASTTMRSVRYHRRQMPQPVLLRRDRDVMIGLAIPFVIIGAVRAFGWTEHVLTDDGEVELWYTLLTGLPPIFALARYVFFETRVIERPPKRPTAERLAEAAERTADATEQIANKP